MSKKVFPYLECGICHKANDNLCDDCATTLLQETQIHEDEMKLISAPKKKFIGSGEDGHLYQELCLWE